MRAAETVVILIADYRNLDVLQLLRRLECRDAGAVRALIIHDEYLFEPLSGQEVELRQHAADLRYARCVRTSIQSCHGPA